MPSDPVVQAVFRYPVKGLTPDPLKRVTLTRGETLPFDRAYAIENGRSDFDAAHSKHLPKQSFLMLMRNERLARLRTTFEDTTHTLTIVTEGREAARGDLRTAQGRAAIESFFAQFSADELRGPPKVLSAQGHSFSDAPRKVASIINLASVAALETATGVPVHPLRFRANLYVTGWPAWHEFELLDTTLAVGPARLKVVKRIVRCAATNVDPDTGIRDLTIPATLAKTFGHMDCGVYADVVTGGVIAAGDAVDTPSS